MPGSKLAVDQQAPDLLERVAADELLDVDAAVAKRRALPVGLGDLRLEGDHALEPRVEVAHRVTAERYPNAPSRAVRVLGRQPEWR